MESSIALASAQPAGNILEEEKDDVVTQLTQLRTSFNLSPSLLYRTSKVVEQFSAENMMSLAARSGAFSPFMQATAFAVAGPLKALVPGVVIKGEGILLNPKKKFLCRESLNGQSPMTGPAVTVSINGRSYIFCYL